MQLPVVPRAAFWDLPNTGFGKTHLACSTCCPLDAMLERGRNIPKPQKPAVADAQRHRGREKGRDCSPGRMGVRAVLPCPQEGAWYSGKHHR